MAGNIGNYSRILDLMPYLMLDLLEPHKMRILTSRSKCLLTKQQAVILMAVVAVRPHKRASSLWINKMG